MKGMGDRLAAIGADIDRARGGHEVTLVAVSKLQPAAAVAELAALGQRHFGENYVQEALPKQLAVGRRDLQWHLIGPLQSNKCRDVARHFDWVQTVDRVKLVSLLARERPDELPPLNVLIQVNISDESSKSGCALADIAALAGLIEAEPRLRLRGLMAIPAPWPEPARRQRDFAAMRDQFGKFRSCFPYFDTLSMGMSGDFALAIAQGATMVRIGSALFGARAPRPHGD